MFPLCTINLKIYRINQNLWSIFLHLADWFIWINVRKSLVTALINKFEMYWSCDVYIDLFFSRYGEYPLRLRCSQGHDSAVQLEGVQLGVVRVCVRSLLPTAQLARTRVAGARPLALFVTSPFLLSVVSLICTFLFHSDVIIGKVNHKIIFLW